MLVQQIRLGDLKAGTTLQDRMVNLVGRYLPSLLQLACAALTSRATVVHVTGPALVPIALAHRRVFRSEVIVDINERPAAVSAPGSLFALVAKAEPLLIRAVRKHAAAVTVVTRGHAEILERRFGVEDALVVRNCPLADWRGGWREPPESEALEVVTVGSLFPGRALEMLIRAMGSIQRANGGNVRLTIVGAGTPEYVESLRSLIDLEDVGDVVRLLGPTDSAGVSEAYATGHLGLALYEANDPGNDSLSNKILESVASGRPVLAGDLPENRRFVEANRVGWLTEVSVDGIAESLSLVSGMDRDSLLSLCRRCFVLGEVELTWESEFAPVLGIVERLASTNMTPALRRRACAR